MTTTRFLLITFLASTTLMAQQTVSPPLQLGRAVELALENYPSMKAAQAQISSATAGIELSRTAYLPRTDLLWQENRATHNNVFGLLLPQSTIPAISGPVLGSKPLAGDWGSAGGLLFSWEPFDFGFRRANVDAAKALKEQADSGMAVVRLNVATTAADAFMGVVAADEIVRAAEANVQRMSVFAESVHVLVRNELRPGVESSRANAELAAARNQLIQAQQLAQVNRTNLAEAIGQAEAFLQIDPGPLLAAPAEIGAPTADVTKHPLALSQESAREAARARERALSRSYFPRFNFQTAFYGRGTGADLSGIVNRSEGLLPDTPNWASGLTLTFDPFSLFSLRARQKVEAGNEALESARYDQVVQSLKAQDARARATLEAAQKIAANTPVQLEAARETEIRARVRYEAGLANIIEVADAQRLLAQAEIDHAVARLNVWRALLALARAQGDLKPFLQPFSTATSQGSK
ncbi:MAG TPA: TolC family protein [Acidobacteriota bacterium]